jgi:pyrroline-5-carboxylate reductase
MRRVTQPTVTFIGGGNMARAIYGGLLDSGFTATNISIVDPSTAAQDNARQAGIEQAFDRAPDEALSADLIVLAIKPQITNAALAPLAGRLGPNSVVLSIVAGISTQSLATLLGLSDSGPIIRCMPNTPALVGEGMTGLYSNSHAGAAEGKALAERVMSSVGQCVWVEKEPDLDVVTAISGSGPAYFFLFIESLTDAAIALGMDSESARKLALQTALGASRLASFSDEDAATLRKNVTSPGGTTEQAIQSFETSDIRGIVARATQAAARRSVELSQEFGV